MFNWNNLQTDLKKHFISLDPDTSALIIAGDDGVLISFLEHLYTKFQAQEKKSLPTTDMVEKMLRQSLETDETHTKANNSVIESNVSNYQIPAQTLRKYDITHRLAWNNKLFKLLMRTVQKYFGLQAHDAQFSKYGKRTLNLCVHIVCFFFVEFVLILENY